MKQPKRYHLSYQMNGVTKQYVLDYEAVRQNFDTILSIADSIEITLLPKLKESKDANA